MSGLSQFEGKRREFQVGEKYDFIIRRKYENPFKKHHPGGVTNPAGVRF